jgi:Tol biopolymer transport system component
LTFGVVCLLLLHSTENLAWFPDYSPDGTRIVFCHDMTGAVELYVINVDGTGLTQITHDGTENIFPRWSPDGRRIVFSNLVQCKRTGKPSFNDYHCDIERKSTTAGCSYYVHSDRAEPNRRGDPHWNRELQRS